ncbi:protein TRACHEARY ELEMENT DIFFERENTIATION-RELATED 7A-like [Salvia splendens]|uniref:protein TRACHEARY ELEMENT DIFFERENTIATION-RELATED 7A-like n=1 Tax=Salvia splendens TaxID=180675 RepID=UPI001C27BCD8|nr:protein TRACHEARY ELEMENT DIFFERENTIATION-RELATED 7A-like [Salvia splendens]
MGVFDLQDCPFAKFQHPHGPTPKRPILPIFPTTFGSAVPYSPPPHNSPSPPKFAPPPPPPHHSPSPPPPPKLPLPPPPPPPHPISPPSPHTFSPLPPHPISPPLPPDNSTVVIVVFLSIGGVFFLAFVAAVLFCFIKKRQKKIVRETHNVKIEEHVRVHEDIVPGPHGTPTVVLTIDEDLHVEEEIHNTSEVVKSKGSHLSSQAPVIGESTSIFKHHHNLKD